MTRRLTASLLALLLLAGWVTDDVPLPRELEADGIDEDCGTVLLPPSGARRAAAIAGRGRAIGALDRSACESALRGAGVAFESVAASDASGVEHPIRLAGPLDGVRITPDEGVHSVIDCRLAVALLAWAPDLRAQGVARIEHVSIYRPGARVGGRGRVSGHAHALAIDALAFVLEDGRRLPVLDAWLDRARGVDPCTSHEGDDDGTARMRAAVCAAVQHDLFQVVLTPHHDDAHANHVHLEVRPGVDWSFVH
ncbi:extensin family protein [Sandaracinus amylolyticus]|uniref:Extensin-like protein n=1 Tax=Sandaracinus amylolyticus TaxID=927083 RepID=A0A0F6W5D5_9BACT|nr:extensin family protein [Sandaracinus amylolyticus]AKF07721.1 Extensin-like protein [Sandaracinus amylolyticus]